MIDRAEEDRHCARMHDVEPSSELATCVVYTGDIGRVSHTVTRKDLYRCRIAIVRFSEAESRPNKAEEFCRSLQLQPRASPPRTNLCRSLREAGCCLSREVRESPLACIAGIGELVCRLQDPRTAARYWGNCTDRTRTRTEPGTSKLHARSRRRSVRSVGERERLRKRASCVHSNSRLREARKAGEH